MAGGRKEINVDITAKDDASRKLDQVADQAEKLEKLDPEVEVTADTKKAERQIEEVSDDAKALTRQDTELIIRAKIDQAKGDLKQLQRELDQTGEKAEETNRKLDDTTGGGGGINTRGTAIADLTGPLGDASSAASDFAGVFDGIGDIATDVAGKMGASAGTAAKLGGAIGGLGIAVAAGAAAWTLFTQKQADAKRKAEEQLKAQRELNDAIKEGNRIVAATKFQELYGDAISQGKAFGLTVEQIVGFIQGQNVELNETTKILFDLGEKHRAMGNKVADSTLALKEARDQYAANNLTIAEQDDLLHALSNELVTTGRAARGAADGIDYLGRRFDELRGRLDFKQAAENFANEWRIAQEKARTETGLTQADLTTLQQSYLNMAEELGLNPLEVKMNLAAIEQGDIDGVLWRTQQQINAKQPVTIPVVLRPKNQIPGVRIDENGNVIALPTSTAPAAGTVNVNLPRGYRGDVLAEVTGASRRNGRRYGARSVRYARR